MIRGSVVVHRGAQQAATARGQGSRGLFLLPILSVAWPTSSPVTNIHRPRLARLETEPSSSYAIALLLRADLLNIFLFTPDKTLFLANQVSECLPQDVHLLISLCASLLFVWYLFFSSVICIVILLSLSSFSPQPRLSGPCWRSPVTQWRTGRGWLAPWRQCESGGTRSHVWSAD